MMRMYDFHCPHCDAQFDALVEEADRTAGCECPNCAGWADYTISSPYFKEDIMSDKWVKNRQSHMKQEQKNLRNHGTYK